MFSKVDPNSIESDEGFSVRLLPRTGIIYCRDGQQFFVDSEFLAPSGYIVIFANQIYPRNQCCGLPPVPENLRNQIINDISRALQFDGNSVEIA